MAPVELVEASLRQGQQALLLSRLRLRHALPVASLLDTCGFAALDVFGGMTFEGSLRFLAENPFERLRAIREAAPRTPLLASIDGRTLVGHRRAPDDLVAAFVRVAAGAGIDIFRCHDPLNDVRALERCAAAVHAAGRQAEGVICHTGGAVDGLVEVAVRLAAMGFDRLCLHDPLGLPGVSRAREIVERVRRAVPLPLGVSLAAQTGQAGLAYWGAGVAGAGRMDVALAPLAGGASLPSAEAIIAATADTELRTGLDLRQVAAASDRLEELLPLYQEVIDPTVWRYDHSALRGLLPPSAIPHALAELRDRGELGRLEEVELEVTRVRSEMGYPPLIPPITEIIATQAVYNVCDGERYATVSREFGDYCLGLYGEPPEPMDPSIRAAAAARAAEVQTGSMEQIRAELERQEMEASEEAMVCYGLFPDDWVALVRGELRPEQLPDELPEPAASAPVAAAPAPEAQAASTGVRTLTVEVDGQPYLVRISGAAGAEASTGAGAPVPGEPEPGLVVAPMPGLLVSLPAGPGTRVEAGMVVAVLEAMKMQNEISAPVAGRVRELLAEPGTLVAAGQPLLRIG